MRTVLRSPEIPPFFFYLLLAQAEEEAVQEKGILRKNIQVQRPGLYIIYNV